MSIALGLLIIPVVFSFVFLPLERSILVTVIILTFFSLPFITQTYVVVKNGKIYGYTLGGKNKDPNLSLKIEDIEGIKRILKNEKTVGLSIKTSYHVDPTTIRTKQRLNF